MNRLQLIALDETVVFPGMPVTLPFDVGGDDRVLLVPKHDNA
jgi:ATP-dependent Lon protease